MGEVRSVTPYFRSKDHSKGFHQMKKEDKGKYPRERIHDGSTSNQQERIPENLRSPHSSILPTFLKGDEWYSDEEGEPYPSYSLKRGGMMEEDISLLLFQTLESIKEGLKGFHEKGNGSSP